jgi:hypothetical protein
MLRDRSARMTAPMPAASPPGGSGGGSSGGGNGSGGSSGGGAAAHAGGGGSAAAAALIRRVCAYLPLARVLGARTAGAAHGASRRAPPAAQSARPSFRRSRRPCRRRVAAKCRHVYRTRPSRPSRAPRPPQPAAAAAMPKASTRRGAAAAADMEQDAPAGEALPPPQALQDVAPMALFPPITASELLGGKIEWRKARARLQRAAAARGSAAAAAGGGCRWAGALAACLPARHCAPPCGRVSAGWLADAPRTHARTRRTGDCARKPHDAAQGRVDGLVHARDGEHEGGHAHEPEDAQGARRETGALSGASAVQLRARCARGGSRQQPRPPDTRAPVLSVP